MITHEFIILGLLKDSPKHGYEMKKKAKEMLSLFAGIELKSIYYPLMVLEEKGLVEKISNKQGRRPQRFVYALTPKGEKRFAELLTQSFLDFKRPQFSLDLSLYFLHYIKPATAKRRLRGRMLILDRLSRELRKLVETFTKKRNLTSACILEHNLDMVETESKFLSRLIKTL